MHVRFVDVTRETDAEMGKSEVARDESGENGQGVIAHHYYVKRQNAEQIKFGTTDNDSDQISNRHASASPL
jgi:hypothetical protein